MSPPYRVPAYWEPLQPHSYPLVKGEPDPNEAFSAYSSLNRLLDYRAKQQPERLCLAEIDADGGSITRYTFDEARRLVVSFAASLREDSSITPRLHVLDEEVVVALASGNSADFWLNKHALERVGYVPLLLSSTLSGKAAKAVLKESGAQALLVGPGAEELESNALEGHNLPRLPWQTAANPKHRKALSASVGEIDHLAASIESFHSAATTRELLDSTSCLCHTTGSTADPKLVPFHNQPLFSIAPVLAGPSKALFLQLCHPGGMVAAMLTMAAGKALYLSPSTPPDHDTLVCLLRALESEGVDEWVGVPGLIKTLLDGTDDANALKLLKPFKQVMATGGPLDDKTRLKLEGADIPMVLLIGSTEVGVLTSSRVPSVKDWQWGYVPSKALGGDFVTFEPFHSESEDDDSDKQYYEMVLKEGYPSLEVCNRSDGYATGDLFEMHPTDDERVRLWRRKDDVIIHDSGLMSDATGVEAHLMDSEHIRSALVVGEDRPKLAALVVPASSDNTIDDLHEHLRTLNEGLPAQTRLEPGMIAVLKESDEFVVSAKGMTVRSKTADKFRETIDKLYNAD